MRPVALLALLAALLAGGCMGENESSAERPPNRQLERLVLQQADLPRGFDEFADGEMIGVELDPALGRDRTKFGRQAGWVARYRQRRSRAPGPLTVVSTVEAFSRDSGASDYFSASGSGDEQAGMAEVEAPSIGDETRARATKAAGPKAVRYVTIRWRDGRYVASLSAVGYGDRMDVDDIVALARTQQEHVAEAD